MGEAEIFRRNRGNGQSDDTNTEAVYTSIDYEEKEFLAKIADVMAVTSPVIFETG